MAMATCAICGENCRGRCIKCGARLCHLHKPKTGKWKCPKCPRNSKGSASMTVGRRVSAQQYNPQYNPYDPYGSISAPAAAYPLMPAPPAPKGPYSQPHPYSQLSSAYYQPRPDFENMLPDEFIEYAEERKMWLEAKMERELDHLKDRARKQTQGRGKRTRTDQDLENDRPYEEDIRYLLEYLISQARQC